MSVRTHQPDKLLPRLPLEMKRDQEQPIRARVTPASSVIGTYIVILGGLLLVLFCTLYPFTFEQFDRIPRLYRYFSGFNFGGYSRCCKYLAVLEPLANVLFFMPFGFGLTGLIRKKTATWIVAFVVVLLLCFGLSLTVEVLQVFQPWRSASLTDLLMNSIGGCLGFLCFRVWGQAMMRRVSCVFRGK